jgi:hypothetical protein
LLLAMLCFPVSPRADTVTENRVKASYVFNFVKYVEWPPSALDGTDIRICSLGHHPLSGELSQLQGRQAQGHEIQVHAPARPDEWRDCHVLFVPASEQKQVEAVLRAVGQAPVLTVSDSADFAKAGGIIGLKPSAGRIRFDINLVNARRASLTMSSHLLRLAEEVRQ